jgi:ribosomal protein L27
MTTNAAAASPAGPEAAAAAAAQAAAASCSGAAVAAGPALVGGGGGGGAFSSMLLQRRWATKKQGGSTRNSPDSPSKRLGTKLLGGALAFPGQVIARQRGSRYHAGANVGVVSDRPSARGKGPLVAVSSPCWLPSFTHTLSLSLPRQTNPNKH